MADALLLRLGEDVTQNIASFLPKRHCHTFAELVEVVTSCLAFPFATVRFTGKSRAQDWSDLFARDDISTFLGTLEIVGERRLGGFVSQTQFEAVVTSFESRHPIQVSSFRLRLKAAIADLPRMAQVVNQCAYPHECSFKVLDTAHLEVLAEQLEREAKRIRITALELKTLNVDETSLLRLCRTIGRSSNITSLAFSPGLSDTCAEALFEALVGNKTLTKLELYDGRIGAGASATNALAGMLTKNTCLRSLGLGRNQVRLHLDVFANSLAYAAMLTYLDLSANQLDDSSMCALRETLRQNNCLLQLNLVQNCVTEVGVMELNAGLKQNVCLEVCSLYFNPICTLRRFVDNLDSRIQL